MPAAGSTPTSAGTPSTPSAQSASAGRPTRWRRILAAFASLGPFALIFGTYSVLLDHLPDRWFSVDWVRYTFAVCCALIVGVGLRQLLQLPAVSDVLRDDDQNVAVLLPGPRAPVDGHAPSLPDLFEGIRERLLADYRTVDRGGFEASGWSQFFGDDTAPTPIGSSYGLRIAMCLDIRDSVIDRRKVIDSILAQRRPDGGWSASSQRDVGRPEVTSWVLGVLPLVGLGGTDRAAIVAALEQMLDADADPTGMNRTCVITTAVSTLAAVAPRSPHLARLAGQLAHSALPAGGGRDQAAWGVLLRSPDNRASVPHTARAVVALHRAAAVLPDGPKLRQRAAEGTSWLLDNFDLRSDDEQIRRPYGDGADVIYVGHFTPAWVSRALMLDDRHPRHSEQLTAAVHEVAASQQKGMWRWHEWEPIWMAYQGVSVLREYVLRTHGLPP